MIINTYDYYQCHIYCVNCDTVMQVKQVVCACIEFRSNLSCTVTWTVWCDYCNSQSLRHQLAAGSV